jgi:hypothetical protein
MNDCSSEARTDIPGRFFPSQQGGKSSTVLFHGFWIFRFRSPVAISRMWGRTGTSYHFEAV